MQHFESYDPLTIEDHDRELLVAAKKREIRNILKSYTGYFDPFAEVLQNAFDAVERRAYHEDVDYLPEIWIDVDISANSISVTDNGCGMAFEEFQKFLKPNYSFKIGDKTRGMKGVGATYLAYGFNDLHVSTKLNGKVWSGRIQRGREWAEDSAGEVDIPMFAMSETPAHKHFESIDMGTSVTIRLVGDKIRPSDLSWAGAANAQQWLAILRIHTPLGAIYIEPDQPDFEIRINLQVSDGKGEVTRTSLSNPEYLYPHLHFNPVVNIRDVLIWKRKEALKGGIPKLPKRYTNLSAFWTTLDITDIEEDQALFPVNLTAEHLALARELNVRIYYFMCYSKDLWGQVKTNLGLSKRAQFLQGGLQLATRNMPQGPILLIPLNRMLGFQDVTHIIIHIDAEPDLGRKGFQPEHVDLARTLARRLVEHYGNNYRWELLRKQVGTRSAVRELQLEAWIDEQRVHEETHPLSINKPQVFSPLTHLPTRSEPQVEQDVVALFNQMLAAGIIRGIHILSSSQYEQYDGLYRRILDIPYDFYVYDPDSNPLGVVRDAMGSPEKPLRSKIRVLEYKYSFDALVEDLSQQDKDAKALDLVVAWERGTKWNEVYSLTSFLTSENIRHREFHGYTHRFSEIMSGNTVFNAIILKDLISYVNDSAAEERRQDLLENQY